MTEEKTERILLTLPVKLVEAIDNFKMLDATTRQDKIRYLLNYGLQMVTIAKMAHEKILNVMKENKLVEDRLLIAHLSVHIGLPDDMADEWYIGSEIREGYLKPIFTKNYKRRFFVLTEKACKELGVNYQEYLEQLKEAQIK